MVIISLSSQSVDNLVIADNDFVFSIFSEIYAGHACTGSFAKDPRRKN